MRKDIHLSPGTIRNMAQALQAQQEGTGWIQPGGPWTPQPTAFPPSFTKGGIDLMKMAEAYRQQMAAQQAMQQQQAAPGVATAQSGP